MLRQLGRSAARHADVDEQVGLQADESAYHEDLALREMDKVKNTEHACKPIAISE